LKKQDKEARKTEIFKPLKIYQKTISNKKKQERNINQK